jgi:hypothetical protein
MLQEIALQSLLDANIIDVDRFAELSRQMENELITMNGDYLFMQNGKRITTYR